MKINLHIRIPHPISHDWERQAFADSIIYGLTYEGDRSPKFDSGKEFCFEWMVKQYIARFNKPTASASEIEDVVTITFDGATVVHQYKMISLFMIYWCASNRQSIPDADTYLTWNALWDDASTIISERVDSSTIYTKLDQRIAWINDRAERTLFSI